ncbi:MAG: RecX family transcriptional regulator [Flavobacteriales bacterium]|nr:RecX family transcriptional regulator [Flavobacteriales bacterium]
MGQKLTSQQGLVKAQKYCVYQERCHFEVRNKLYDWGLYSVDVEEVISSLIQDNFLNEERFAEAFARGKFRVKKWGRIKILSELNRRHISEYCKKKGLEQIDEQEYMETLADVLIRREKQEKEINPFIRKQKLASYLNSRGFESDLVWELLNARVSE